PSKHHQGFAGVADGPAALDEIAGHAAAKKIAQIGSEKWDPDGNQTAFQRDSLGDEIDGDPIGDEKKNWIGKSTSDDGSPGLRQFQEIAPARPNPVRKLLLGRVGEDHFALCILVEGMFLRAVVELRPRKQPGNAEKAGNKKARAPAVTEINPQY